MWDIPVRVFHALLAATCAGAWWTSLDARHLDLHVGVGLAAVGLVAFRALWARIGTRHARLDGLLWAPRAVRSYAAALARGRAPRALGHTPIAGWAAVAALLLVLLLGVTGMAVWSGEQQAGPLSGVLSPRAGVRVHAVHTALAWALLGWIAVHLAGVLKESLRTRENLPRAIVSGWKRTLPGAESVPALARWAALPVLLASGFAALPAATPVTTPVAVATNPAWEGECGSCHLAFPPSLLPARSWERMLDEQDRHFGEDLFLDETTLAPLRAFARSSAAEAGQTEHAVRIADSLGADEAPQRITELRWWAERHADVPAADFTAVGESAELRCAACHPDADRARFDAAEAGVLPPSQGANP